ncbi:vacuolar iron transporter homolog 4-like [Gastrolobium bilobum]|uniref:vacuolar iron transporter homolog 4-like n=1 Tax=Gastrolobium bilobum TaxID=150636 RepID=UPI002AB1B832|nr:vacuolar iron transporter homolog 4-like [Gastrolobium bilobum]
MGDIKPCHNNPVTSSEASPTKMFHLIDVERKREEKREIEVFDYAKRAQWLRAAVLGANDGLISTASLMIGVGAVRQDIKTMMLTGVAGLVAGACSMAIGEFVSVYAQCDIEVAQMIREGKETHEEKLPNPFQAALASGLSFAVGAAVPLFGAVFIEDYKVRLGVVAAVVSIALLVFGGLGAVLGKVPLVKSSLRVLIGGWLAMVVTFGLIKLVGHVVDC